MEKQTIHCLIDDAHGIYVPQAFAQGFDMVAWSVHPEDAAILSSGPDTEYYWDTWDTVLNDAKFTDEHGETWYLYQEGDLFVVSENHEWEE